MHEAKTLALLEWLVRSGLSGAGEAQLVSGFCEELVRLGIPLVRVSVASDLLDPIYDARGLPIDRLQQLPDQKTRARDDRAEHPGMAKEVAGEQEGVPDARPVACLRHVVSCVSAAHAKLPDPALSSTGAAASQSIAIAPAMAVQC